MNKINGWICRVIAVFALLGLGSGNLQAVTHNLRATACGTWDSAGNHTVGDYFTGFSRERPHDTVSYYIFDLSSIRGRHVTGCTMTITGTRDFTFTAVWSGHSPSHQFKVGSTPMNPGKMTVAEVMTGNHNPSIWRNVHGEQDLGYKWLVDGLHPGVSIDTFHYNNRRLQDAVNRGGLFAIFEVNRFSGGNTGEQYVWGASHFAGAQLVLNITTN